MKLRVFVDLDVPLSPDGAMQTISETLEDVREALRNHGYESYIEQVSIDIEEEASCDS